ncbi:Myo22.2 family protein [Megaselia abdita]
MVISNLPIKGAKLRPKSPIQSAMNSSSTNQSQNIRLSGHEYPLASPSSPKLSRPSSRTSSIGSNHQLPNEREQRRKFRIEKKLQEMQQIDLTEKANEVVKEDVLFDILEFADNYFNTH